MVKKRRLNNAGKTRVSDKSPARGDELVSARDRFKGALQELLPHSEDDSDSRSDDDTWSKSKRSLRKKLQNDKIAEEKQQPFVMKLCDRSVDLAQFNEGTPLYVICRAWMANQPHQMYNITVPPPKRSRTPEIKEEPLSPSREEEAAVKDTYSLPPPYKSEDNDINIRIPKPVHRDTEFTEMFNKDAESPSKEELLEDNRKHWLKVRRSWYDAAAENEKRYARSLKTIANIFNKKVFIGNHLSKAQKGIPELNCCVFAPRIIQMALYPEEPCPSRFLVKLFGGKDPSGRSMIHRRIRQQWVGVGQLPLQGLP